MYQTINFLRNLPIEKIISDEEIKAIYLELRAIFEKNENKISTR